jgi:hypothetical protein
LRPTGRYGGKVNGATFETPKALFKTHADRSDSVGIDYDVTADGQRFLIGTRLVSNLSISTGLLR